MEVLRVPSKTSKKILEGITPRDQVLSNFPDQVALSVETRINVVVGSAFHSSDNMTAELRSLYSTSTELLPMIYTGKVRW